MINRLQALLPKPLSLLIVAPAEGDCHLGVQKSTQVTRRQIAQDSGSSNVMLCLVQLPVAREKVGKVGRSYSLTF
jgi:hypothetical protein